MAKFLKHFGLTGKKTKKQKSEYGAQKSTSIHELPPKIASKYQSNVYLDRCDPGKYDKDYDTRSLKIYANVNIQNGHHDLWLENLCSRSQNSIDNWGLVRQNSAITSNLIIHEEYCDPIDTRFPSSDQNIGEQKFEEDLESQYGTSPILDHEYTLPYDAMPIQKLDSEIKVDISPKKIKKKNKSKKISKYVVDTNLSLDEQSWYHGILSRSDAESLLSSSANGTFLVRKSEIGEFTLSIKSSPSFHHLKIEKIERNTMGSDLNFAPFSNIGEIIESGSNPIMQIESINTDITNSKPLLNISSKKCSNYILGQFSQPFEDVNSIISYYTNYRLPIKGSQNIRLIRPYSKNV